MFITLEGIEGSGKTTQAGYMVEFLEDIGREYFITREPGGTKIGEKIRAILLDTESKGLTPHAELLLYIADRVQHVQEKILPALSKGLTVICDRYYDATLVYQGYARGLDLGLIQKLHELVFENLKPDMTFLFDLSPEIGLRRAWARIDKEMESNGDTRFEEEKLSFHKKVRDGYLRLAKLEPQRFHIIDAGQTEPEVKKQLIKILDSKLGK